MPRHFGLAVLALAICLAVLFGGAALMERVTGHGIVVAALKKADLKALNERIVPYDAQETARVWNVIDGTPGGRGAERAFLRLDLIFPLFYGGALALSILMLARVLGANGLPWLTPAVIGVVADWTENTIHLRQFGAFDGAAASLDAGLIQLAGYATAVKLVFVVLSLLLIPALPWFLRGRVS